MNESQKGSARSRCIGVCTLNAESVCGGCHRNLEEISRWANASADEREEINQVAAAREQQMSRRTA